jgi:formylglycine-generating enzyme required for sulfatase activity
MKISLEGIESAISGLNYRNPNTAKAKLIQSIKSFYNSSESIDTVRHIDNDTLIDRVWDLGGDLEAIKSKRKNLSIIKSSVNADLNKGWDNGKNPEGVIVGSKNTFEMSNEAKDSFLSSFSGAMDLEGVEGNITMDKVAEALHIVTDYLSGLENQKELNDLSSLKSLVQGLVSVLGSEEEGAEFEVVKKKGEEDAEEPLDAGEGEDEEEGLSDEEGLEDEDLEVIEEEGFEDEIIEEVEDDDDEFEEIEVTDEEFDEEDADEAALDAGEGEDEGEGLGDEEGLEEDDLEVIEDEDLEVIEEEGFEDEIIEEVEDDEDELEEIEVADEEFDEVDGGDDEYEEEDEEIEEVIVDDDIVDEDLETEEIEEIEAVPEDEIDDIETVDDDDELDDDVEVIPDEMEIVEEAEDEIDEVGEDEGSESETEHDQDVGLPIDDLSEEDFDFDDTSLDEEEKKLLAERFDGYLGAMERYYNQYILIPKGKYIIGSDDTEEDTLESKKVTLSDYYTGKYPVTNALFEIFIERTGYKTTAEKNGFGYVYSGRFQKIVDSKTGNVRSVWNPSSTRKKMEGAFWYQPMGPGSNLHNKRNHPVVQVSAKDAFTFAAWTGKRLPTEIEWEGAARTTAGLSLPWGDEWKEGQCNIEDSGFSDTSSVDQYVESGNTAGLSDLLGNVMEWTADLCEPKFPVSTPTKYYVAKGGAWISSKNIRLYSRYRFEDDFAANILGFRCVVD